MGFARSVSAGSSAQASVFSQTIPGRALHREENARAWIDFIRDRAELELKDKPRHGSNPDVFYYQITEADEYGVFLIKLCFYSGLNVYAALLPETSTPPPNLAVELLSKGVATVITLGDKTYGFNSDPDPRLEREH
jgi:hypothetical protein